MSLPYFLGCPSWSENAWREYLYPQDARANQYLELYSQVFNAVEGNTTFYARPAPATVERWAQTMPEHFRFTAKFPGDISHGGDLREQLTAAETFVQLLSPLGGRVAPFWLQLSKAFTPQRLAELAGFIDGLQCPLAVRYVIWERQVLQPAAEEILGSRVARVDNYGSYACRRIYNSDQADARPEVRVDLQLVTPTTMLFTRLRVRPCRARLSLSSSERSTTISLPRKFMRFPAERADARSLSPPSGKFRCSRHRSISTPTAPVAPTIAT